MTETPAEPSIASAPDQGAFRAHRSYVLALLLVIYAFNIIDRKILTILQEPIKAEFHLADWQLGLLTGFAFALLYTVLGIPIARWADGGGKRVNIIAGALAIWSVMTGLCGMANSFMHLLLARVGVGIGEAGCSPPAMSMLADFYPRSERGRAMGIYALGLPIGTAAGLAMGGWLAQQYGWRVALMAVGFPGVVLAVLMKLTVKEPPRGFAENRKAGPVERAPLGQVLKVMLGKPTYVMLLVAGSLGAFCSLGLQFWFPSFFMRAYGMSMTQVGLWWGLSAGAAGLLGAFGGGWLADRFGARDPRYILLLPAIGLLIGMPFQIIAVMSPSPMVALVCLLVPTTMNSLWTAPNMVLTQSLAPLSMRAMSSAISTFTTGIIGLGVGPMLLGLSSDLFAKAAGSAALGLRYALIAVAVVYIAAAASFVIASRTVHKDLES